MKKHSFKFLTLLALAILIQTAFSSCSGKNAKSVISVIADGKTEYTIVRGDESADFETKAAISLRKGIGEKTKVDFPLTTDWVKKGEKIPETAKEIVVGNTNRPESKEVIKKLSKRKNNEKDFAIVVSGERIVVAAMAEEGYSKAIEYFLKNYIKDGTVKIPSNTEYYSLYAYKEISVGGTDLSKFVIVTGEDDNYLNVKTAEAISSYVKTTVGYSLPIVTDKTKEEKYEILLGNTNRKIKSAGKSEKLDTWDYSLTISGTKILLSGGSAKALEYGGLAAFQSIIDGKETAIDENFSVKGNYLDVAKAAMKAEPKAAAADLTRFEIAPNRNPAVYLIDDESFSKWGLTSGWDYDGRGANPDAGHSDGRRNMLEDISSEEPTKLTREFTKWNSGTLTLETAFTIRDSVDGFHYYVRNDKGEAALHLFTRGKKMIAEGPGGTETSLCEVFPAMQIKLKVHFDFIARKETIFINDKDYGTLDFASDCEYVNVVELSTGVAEKLSVLPSFTKLYANHAVNERFLTCVDTNPPRDFEITKGKNSKVQIISNPSNANIPDSYSLKAETAEGEKISILKKFSAVQGSVVFELKFLAETRADGTNISLQSGGKDVVSVSTKLLSLYSGSGELIAPYYSRNVWQTLRVEADTRTQKAALKLNGKYIANVNFQTPAASFDSLSINTVSPGVLWVDDILVFSQADIDDYVPEPIPAESDDNVIGINICSLWRQGTHEGWDVITPYPEIKPYLGYYEDGSPEVADWEIKWMAEHGIDFQLFCWYASTPNSPMKTTHLSDALLNGYFNARYSDKVKFAILWEAANASKPGNSKDFREHFVPLWIDYFLSDSRYMTIDNKPVIAVFGADKLIESLGSEAAVRKEFDYVRNICREMGFDGAIFMASSGAQDAGTLRRMKNAGFDSVYAYNWGKSGSDPDYTKQMITNQQRFNEIHVVPTLSTGFNNVGWAGTRSENMTVEDFETVLTWIRDSALNKNAKENWQKKFLMLSTWNEYGEGTYIMPSGLNGFGYLDALRRVFTKNEAHTDAVPTETQKARLGYLYPQDRSIIKPLGYESEPIPDKVIYAWDFKKSEDAAGWKQIFNVQDFTNSGGKLSGTGVSSDFGIGTISTALNIDISAVTHVHIRMKNTTNGVAKSNAELFFTTAGVENFNAQMRSEVRVIADGQYHDYYFPVYQNSAWNGKLSALRLDPLTTAGTFEITTLELMGYKNQAEIYIDGRKLSTTFRPQTAKNGTLMLPINPADNIFNLLKLAYRWNREEQTLQIYNEKHSLLFTVGKSKAVLDGAEVPIGSDVYLYDGLPAVPIELLVKSFGYSIKYQEKTIQIKTA